jgi:hypothetical protein
MGWRGSADIIIEDEVSMGASEDAAEDSMEDDALEGASDDIEDIEESMDDIEESIEDDDDEASWARAAVARTAATAVVARRVRIIVVSLGSTLCWTCRAARSRAGSCAARFEV